MRIIYLLLLASLLSGCEVLQQLEVIPAETPAAPAESPVTHQLMLSRLQNWDLTGRLSIRQGDEAWHATIRWQQHEDSYSIDIIGPLGQGGLRLQGAAFEIISDDETGFLIPPDDAKTLAERLSMLANDRDLLERTSIKALERYRQQPTWDETAGNIREFLHVIASRRLAAWQSPS